MRQKRSIPWTCCQQVSAPLIINNLLGPQVTAQRLSAGTLHGRTKVRKGNAPKPLGVWEFWAGEILGTGNAALVGGRS